MNPVIRRNGELFYRLADGGAITDEKLRIRVDKISYQATLTALTLGAQRFAGQTLTIEGTGEFKQQAVEVAAALNLQISFSDPEMEADRQGLILTRSARLPSPALAAFISDQNKLANTLSPGYRHRPWGARDAGPLIYHGQRRLRDGSWALLLKNSSEILVKTASEEDTRKAALWQLGSSVCFDRLGRITGRTRQ